MMVRFVEIKKKTRLQLAVFGAKLYSNSQKYIISIFSKQCCYQHMCLYRMGFYETEMGLCANVDLVSIGYQLS